MKSLVRALRSSARRRGPRLLVRLDSPIPGRRRAPKAGPLKRYLDRTEPPLRDEDNLCGGMDTFSDGWRSL